LRELRGEGGFGGGRLGLYIRRQHFRQKAAEFAEGEVSTTVNGNPLHLEFDLSENLWRIVYETTTTESSYIATGGSNPSSDPWLLDWTDLISYGITSIVITEIAERGRTLHNGTITGTITIGNAAAFRTAAKVPSSDATGITGADAIANIVSLTAAEYAAITPSSTTLYVVI